MDKKQKLKIALPILAVVMFFVWKPVIMGSGPKDKDHNTHSSVGHSVSSANISQADIAMMLNVGKTIKARTQYKDWDRNPFVLGQSRDTMAVEGIVWEQQIPKAMINGNIFGVGDIVGKIKIIDIKSESVVFEGEEGEFELYLGETR